MLEPALQRPNDSISLLPVAVRQVHDVAVDVVLAHQVAQVRQHGVLQRPSLDADGQWPVVAHRHQYLGRRLADVPAPVLNLFHEPLAVVRHLDDGDRRLVQPLLTVGCLLGHFFKPGQVHGHEVAAVVRLLAVLQPLLFEDVRTSVREGRHVLSLKGKT